MVQIDRNGLEVLDRESCLRLLRTATLGRIAITVGALSVILPITFTMVDDQIVFRTAPGTKLDAATQNAVVAFEVDDFDPLYHSGWSVAVTGVACEISDPSDAMIRTTPRWAPGADGRVVAIPLDRVSGRRLDGGHVPVGADIHDSG